MDKAVRNPATERRDASYTYQTKPLQTDGIMMAVLGAAALGVLQGYFWMQDGETWKTVLLGAGAITGITAAGWGWWRWRKARSRAHDPLLIKEKVSRIAFGAELQVTAILPKGDSGKRSPRAAGFRCGSLPPLRQPRRRSLQGGQGAAYGAGTVLAARFHGALRQAQRPGGAGDGLPVAPAGG